MSTTFPRTQAASSISDYFRAVEHVWQSWNRKRTETLADIWFRGHANSSWSLAPSAGRPPFETFSEHRLRHDFLLRAQPFLSELAVAPQTDWDWYFLMQHYGVPTRLLDWTESALVALYFALAPSGSADANQSSCVWLLDPRCLNEKIARIGDFVPIYNDSQIAEYLPSLWDESGDRRPLLPVAIDPPANSPRLAAQRGKFTVQGRGAGSIETYELLGNGLQRIVISAKHKNAIRRQFLLTGVTEGTLFPGLSGVAAEITSMYSRTW